MQADAPAPVQLPTEDPADQPAPLTPPTVDPPDQPLPQPPAPKQVKFAPHLPKRNLKPTIQPIPPTQPTPKRTNLDMDKVSELRSQLKAYRNAAADEQTRADCFPADWELELFESYLRSTLDRRETHLLMAKHHNSSSHPVLYDPQLPQVFAFPSTHLALDILVQMA
ncbi:hypothetical protein TSAR_000486 [Trichomalopsis sarcophagae]|uniref:Uncharacterized protein n=1 Tax=Trichomalopsis sarcophagae TaxID=543379 RepID=A0A232ENV2_9HYME|nr:hypothetical protein TSAR_000486 [Trichomalopsis sarcophagae]